MDPYTGHDDTIQQRIYATIEAEARLTLEAHGLSPTQAESALRELADILADKVMHVPKTDPLEPSADNLWGV